MQKSRNPKAFVTNEVLDTAIKHIIYVMVMHDLFNDMKTYIDKRFSKNDKHFSSIDKRLGRLESGQLEIKRQINDLKVDTPTMKEFNELKKRSTN